MSIAPGPGQVLALSNCIKNKIGIKHNISSLEDIGIEFFEEVFSYISPNYVTSNQPACKRFRCILQWLSDYLDAPLDHISVDSLVLCDPLNLHNLLEILELCVDANGIPNVYSPDHKLSEGSGNVPQSRSEMDAALEQSRLNYLSCKLAEMFPPDLNETSPPPSIEVEPDKPPKSINASGPRVKFVDVPRVIAPRSADPSHSSRSILRVIERPLRQGLRSGLPPTLCAKMQQYLRLLRSVSCEVPSQDANILLQELLKHLDLFELSRETRNYIALKLQLFLDTTRAAASSSRRTRAERRLEELADRQRRRIELMKRQTADAERMLRQRDSRASQRLFLSEMRQLRCWEVLDRYFCLRHDEHLRALAAARKAQKEQIVKEVIDAALEKARQNRIERNNLRCEVRRKEVELQDLLISTLENRRDERVMFLNDEQNERRAEMDLQAKSTKMSNLREKVELRRQLTRQIKELEEVLLNRAKSLDLREFD